MLYIIGIIVLLSCLCSISFFIKRKRDQEIQEIQEIQNKRELESKLEAIFFEKKSIKPFKDQSFCLEARDSSTSENVPLNSIKCNGEDNQKWTLHRNGMIINNNTNLCLDVLGNEKKERSEVGQYTCIPHAENQKWIRRGNHLESRSVQGMCLDLEAADTKDVQDGMRLVLWPCGNFINQQWIFN